MANNKDFIVKNAVEVGGPTKVTVGDAASSGSYTAGYDLANASYDSVSFSVTGQETVPTGLAFNNDGTKMYITGDITNGVYQYSLSTAFDLSTASYDSVSLIVTSQDGNPRHLAFNNDGTKMYIVGTGNASVYQYSLSTAFDLSTASYDSVSFSVSSQNTNPRQLTFNGDGTKMFIVGLVGNVVYQYSLSTAFDLSTASYDSVSFSVNAQDTSSSGGTFNSNGTKMFIVGGTNDTVFQYSLSTGFDLSTASYDNISFSVSGQDGIPGAIVFNTNGDKMFIIGNTNDSVYQYSTGSTVTTGSFDLSTGNYFTDTPSADVEYTFSNAGDVQSFQLEVTGNSTYTVTWDADIAWPSGTAPDSPAAGEKDIYTFTTDDGGTTYIGVQSGDAFS